VKCRPYRPALEALESRLNLSPTAYQLAIGPDTVLLGVRPEAIQALKDYTPPAAAYDIGAAGRSMIGPGTLVGVYPQAVLLPPCQAVPLPPYLQNLFDQDPVVPPPTGTGPGASPQPPAPFTPDALVVDALLAHTGDA
jgi:hypothetical protein